MDANLHALQTVDDVCQKGGSMAYIALMVRAACIRTSDNPSCRAVGDEARPRSCFQLGPECRLRLRSLNPRLMSAVRVWGGVALAIMVCR